ncbi:hypothetical protein EMCRGX_G022631 [Ephydatia muelleri]
MSNDVPTSTQGSLCRTQQLCVWKLHKEYCEFVVSLSGHILIEHDVYYKRIESWWSRLRNFKTEWWIQLFKNLDEKGLFDTASIMHRHLAAYVFLPILAEGVERV